MMRSPSSTSTPDPEKSLVKYLLQSQRLVHTALASKV